ncbi:MAG: pyridoxal kinase PdxY [Spirochaetia bacterium]|nr:pyridoxal kinase PdxY [Spirochaetia bacterium]
MAILSIQSHVVFGHVGNRAAVFPLERMGLEVLPLNTVQFSSHTGYEGWTGMSFPAQHLRDILEGLRKSGVLASCEAVLSGYLGDPENADAVVGIVKELQKQVPGCLYCCDPVLGDDEHGIYVKPEVLQFLQREVLAQASILKPNRFEAELLSGVAITTEQDIKEACQILHEKGPGIIVVSSLENSRDKKESISMVLSCGGAGYRITTPRLYFNKHPHGAGDLASALFLGQYLKSKNPLAAFERMANVVFAVFQATHQAGSRELRLVEAQGAFAAPPELFRAEQIW